jgi:hypothetical protein
MTNIETIYIWPDGEWLYYWESGYEKSDDYIELDIPAELTEEQVEKLVKELINK